MLILVFGIDNVDKFAGAVVRRISVAESSTSFTDSVVVELASGVVVGIGFSVSESTRISFGVEDKPIEGKMLITGLVAVVVSTF